MAQDINKGLVRILKSDGSTSGAGFLASADGLIVTCSHVIQADLENGKASPGRVTIVLQSTGERRDTRVEKLFDAAEEDVAALRIEGDLPQGVKPLLLGSSAGTSGHRFRTFGFPDARSDKGLWGYGTIGDRIDDEKGRPLLQLTDTTEVTPGFSGAPIFDELTRRVVGIATAIVTKDRWERLGETAIATPSETIEVLCPQINRSDICPYKSLKAFTEDDFEFFFGRNKVVERLLKDMRQEPRFLAVFGASGSGKSSVIQAGLVPRLRRRGIRGSDLWGIIISRPSNNPLEYLEKQGLDGASKGLALATENWLRDHPDNERLLLILDQFEEIFTTCHECLRRAFMEMLIELLESSLPITVMLVMRDDFFGHMSSECPAGLIKWMEKGFISMPSTLEPEELMAVIKQPAEKVGLSFEEGLMDVIIKDVLETTKEEGRSSGRTTVLPLLESALTELWIESQKQGSGLLTHADYNAIGGVSGGLAQWANNAFIQLDPEMRPLAKRVLTELVYLGNEAKGIPDSRMRRPIDSLARREEERVAVRMVIQNLADARLLVTYREKISDLATVEIIHDSLIREWKRLKDWLKEDRSFLAWRQDIENRAETWVGTFSLNPTQRDEGKLIRGRDLVDAEKWLKERGLDLNQSTREYVKASLDLKEIEERNKRRRQHSIIAGLALALVVTSVYGFSSYQLWQGALSSQMATQAELLRTQEAGMLQYSVLLAGEALNRSYSLEADQTLRRGLALLPHPVAKVIHGYWVEEVAFNYDGRYMATASDDGTAKVCEILSNREIANLSLDSPVQALAFSPKEDLLAIAGRSGILKLWSAKSNDFIFERMHNGTVDALNFSQDGKLLATGSRDGIVKIWDVDNGDELVQLEHNSSVNDIVFSPRGGYIAIAYSDCTVRICKIINSRQIFEISSLAFNSIPRSLAFSPDNTYLAVICSKDSIVHIFEAIEGNWEHHSLQAITNLTHDDMVNDIAFSPDSKSIATASEDMTACIWDVRSGKRDATLHHEWGVTALAFSPDGGYLATSSYDKTARVWETATGWEVTRMVHDDYVVDVAFSPDGRHLATASYDSTARVWEISSDCLACIYHDCPVNEICFSQDGKYLATASTDGTAHLLDLTTLNELKQWEHESCVNDVAISPDGKYIATACEDGKVYIHEIGANKEITCLKLNDSVNTIAFSPGGDLIATASNDKTARLWQWKHDPPLELKRIEHSDYVNRVAFSSDGRYLATAGMDNIAKIWDLKEDYEFKNIVHNDLVWDIAFSKDGRYFVTASDDCTAVVLDISTGQNRSFEEHTDVVEAVTFSPDSRYVATASHDGTVRVWEAASGKRKALMTHGNRVYDVSFSPSGEYIATASDDNTARVWEISTQREVALVLHNRGVKRVLFSTDGDLIATASDDGTVKLWQWKKNLDPEVGLRAHVTQSVADPTFQRFVSAGFVSKLEGWIFSIPAIT
jgi:WD40 repeat protein